MTQQSFVELKNVTKRFGTNTVIDDLSLSIPAGSMVTPARPVRLRKNHRAASGGGAGKTDRR
ncbi:ferric transporter ATP-binding subunit [Morganella morganii]|nr:ferric transporter ATP-binding subunit [Morganella morganii]